MKHARVAAAIANDVVESNHMIQLESFNIKKKISLLKLGLLLFLTKYVLRLLNTPSVLFLLNICFLGPQNIYVMTFISIQSPIRLYLIIVYIIHVILVDKKSCKVS